MLEKKIPAVPPKYKLDIILVYARLLKLHLTPPVVLINANDHSVLIYLERVRLNTHYAILSYAQPPTIKPYVNH